MDTDNIILTVWFGVVVVVGFATLFSIVVTMVNRDPGKKWWPTLALVALAVIVAGAYVAVGGTFTFGDVGCWGQCA